MTALRDMHLLKADGAASPSVTQDRVSNDEPHVSPDGRWIAYGSVESGRWNIYLASFPDLRKNARFRMAGAHKHSGVRRQRAVLPHSRRQDDGRSKSWQERSQDRYSKFLFETRLGGPSQLWTNTVSARMAKSFWWPSRFSEWPSQSLWF